MSEFLTAIFQDMTLAFVVAVCWGVLFGSPRRVLWVAGLLGGAGHCLRFVLLEVNVGLLPATLIAAVAIGLAGIFFAHRVNNPPVVFTLPACITMIPGLHAYRSMLGCIKIADENFAVAGNADILAEVAHNAMLTFSLLVVLAIGISVGMLLFRKRSIKEITFNWRRR